MGCTVRKVRALSMRRLDENRKEHTMPSMPELPETETVRRALETRALGMKVVEATYFKDKWSGAGALEGKHITAVRRRGKFIIIEGENTSTIVHLGMSGNLTVTDHARGGKHLKAHLVLEDGEKQIHIELVDPRGFGRWSLNQGGGLFDQLGSDPLQPDWDEETAAEGLAGKPKEIKALLMEQKHFGGVGNYMADEALYASRIHPKAKHLSPEQARSLVKALTSVVQDSLEAGGMSEKDWKGPEGLAGDYFKSLQAHGKAGQPCPRCANPLVKATVAGRGTTWCETCAPLGQ